MKVKIVKVGQDLIVIIFFAQHLYIIKTAAIICRKRAKPFLQCSENHQTQYWMEFVDPSSVREHFSFLQKGNKFVIYVYNVLIIIYYNESKTQQNLMIRLHKQIKTIK